MSCIQAVTGVRKRGQIIHWSPAASHGQQLKLARPRRGIVLDLRDPGTRPEMKRSGTRLGMGTSSPVRTAPRDTNLEHIRAVLRGGETDVASLR